jgi:hypothetical protein
MFSKCIGLVLTMAVLGSYEVGAAQKSVNDASAAPTPALPPISPSFHDSATLGGTLTSGGHKGGTNAISSQAVTGWNYIHATNCSLYSTGYMYIYPQEGGFWFTTDAGFKALLGSQCVQGNWVALYVTDSFGSFNQVWTYNYK